MPSPTYPAFATPPRPAAFGPPRPGALPLAGLTVLAVEDSRFACEALRLLCHRAGARLRRAEDLAGARAHLRVYRPDVVIVDLGLPDGRGEGLIRALALTRPHPMRVLGSSGAGDGRARALAAGADGFVDKPVESLSAFCAAVLACAPSEMAGTGPDPGSSTATPELPIRPDQLALREDLQHAADLLALPLPLPRMQYVSDFLQGIARQCHDPRLEGAAKGARTPGHPSSLADLRAQIDRRLEAVETGFARPFLPGTG